MPELVVSLGSHDLAPSSNLEPAIPTLSHASKAQPATRIRSRETGHGRVSKSLTSFRISSFCRNRKPKGATGLAKANIKAGGLRVAAALPCALAAGPRGGCQVRGPPPSVPTNCTPRLQTKRDTQPPAPQANGVCAIRAACSRRRRDAHDGGLPGAVGPQQGGDLVPVEGEAQALDGRPVGLVLLGHGHQGDARGAAFQLRLPIPR